MKFSRHFLLFSVIAISGCDRGPLQPVVLKSRAIESSELPEKVTFNEHIRPILSDKCFACHGFDSTTREAGLRLDTADGAYAALTDDPEKRAISPGKSKDSEVWRRITSDDPDMIMPVPDFHKPLSPREIQLITAWIDQGAEYQQHWSFAPLEKPVVPKTGHPIDAFVIAKLEREKIASSEMADRETLLRRLSLDLTGLPPTPAELDAFLTDQKPDAYAAQVERLLESPHYGERMAVPWLDVVRFADTVGYHGDQNARVFPYRDYVIRSFNENKPFDQFTLEQIAGDLLPNSTDEQKIATGFLRLNLMTREGGAQAKEYLAKSLGDRVRAVGAAWLGLTTGCAECHDHKFDPITAKDFYSLGAFFADVRQWGVYADYGYTPNPELRGVNNDWPFPPEIQARNAAVEQRLTGLRLQAAEILAESFQEKATQEAAAISEWTTRVREFLAANPTGWKSLSSTEITTLQSTPFQILPDRSALFTGEPKKDEVLTFKLPLSAEPVRAIQLEILPHSENGGKTGRQADGKFSVTPTFSIDRQPLKIAYAQADRRTPHRYQNGNHDPKLEAEWRSAPALWEEPQDGASRPHHAIFYLAEPLVPGSEKFLTVSLASADIGQVRISITPFGEPVPGQTDALRSELKAAILKPVETNSKDRIAGWAQSMMSDAEFPDSYRTIREAIIGCRAGYAHSVVSQPVPSEKIPTTHLLPRGDWMNPAEEVKPAVLQFLPHDSIRKDGERLNRLDLARWLVAKENPLTARQFTNRLWKQFFGKGLSNVLDDLGNQGEWPSHPELLDWLASEFRDSGWDVKYIVRLIVTSHAYRQQSANRSDLVSRDPENRLLAAQSARRLDAEFVRDNILSISGLLSSDIIGGPSVKPYQPAGYYTNLNFPQRDYPASTGDSQYRRGLYMHWQRTFMHPMLAGFDAPSREECSADRLQSNSPQQALILLNDPSFVEAARVFAMSLLREKDATTDSEKIHHAIRRTLSREPKSGEAESLEKFVISQRENYRSKPEEAKAFLKTGYADPGTGFDPIELAAWTQACRVLLNLHETLTRY